MNTETNNAKQPESNNLYQASIDELLTIEHRIDAFCDWNDCEPPELSYEDGSLLLTDNIVDWCLEQSASIDWIICGDPKGMAAAFRKDCQEHKPLRRDLAKLDPEEMRAMTAGVKAYIEGIAPLDQALEAAKAALELVRAKAA